MDSQHQKWVNLSYLALASLVGYVFFTIAGKFSAAYDLETRVRNIDLILRVIAIGISFLFFALFYRNQKINVFMNEVVEELLRVTWPTPK